MLATLATCRVVMPIYCLLAFLALPWAIKAMNGSKAYEDRDRLIKAMGDNVVFILLTQVLLGVGYILEKLFPLS